MGLAEDLRAPVVPRAVVRCAVALLLDRLDGEDRAALLDALATPMDVYPTSILARRLVEGGYRIGDSSLRRHRRGVCQCPS